MSQDSHSQFDHAVLDLIEHSPIGAVPNTPAYQDALIRLYAAHQVYADADHKDGHVTARSLAGRPSFHASNLEALVAGRIGADALESNASIFDRYVQSLPAARREKAESFRERVAGRPAMHRKHGGMLAHDPMRTLFLVPGAGPHPGITGNYLHGYVLAVGAGGPAGAWAVHLHDCDDGAALFDAPTMPEALIKLQEVLECAPFNMDELQALGFRSN